MRYSTQIYRILLLGLCLLRVRHIAIYFILEVTYICW